MRGLGFEPQICNLQERRIVLHKTLLQPLQFWFLPPHTVGAQSKREHWG